MPAYVQASAVESENDARQIQGEDMRTLVAQLIASCCMSLRMSTDFTVAVAEAMSLLLMSSLKIDLLSA